MDGVILGVDTAQEWMLSWWWDHYSSHNDYPVHFFDFGMSEPAIEWCKKRGTVSSFPYDPSRIASQDTIAPELLEKWSQIYVGDIWQTRPQWFKKSFACERSPFSRTLWLDTDCQILGSIAPLFSYISTYPYFAAAQEYKTNVHFEPKLENAPIFNSGVLAFSGESPIIREWCKGCEEHNHELLGDQSVLSYIIQEKGFQITPLPLIYNCNPRYSEREKAQIIHWVGFNGKASILEMILLALKPMD